MQYKYKVIIDLLEREGPSMSFGEIMVNTGLDYCTADTALRNLVHTGVLVSNCSCTQEDAQTLDGLIFWLASSVSKSEKNCSGDPE